eukprot:8509836-Karenia_brevis.AAC.1
MIRNATHRTLNWPFTAVALSDADKVKRAEELSWPVVSPDQDHDDEDSLPRGSACVAHGVYSAKADDP